MPFGVVWYGAWAGFCSKKQRERESKYYLALAQQLVSEKYIKYQN
jgi:hypothetical protein